MNMVVDTNQTTRAVAPDQGPSFLAGAWTVEPLGIDENIVRFDRFILDANVLLMGSQVDRDESTVLASLRGQTTRLPTPNESTEAPVTQPLAGKPKALTLEWGSPAGIDNATRDLLEIQWAIVVSHARSARFPVNATKVTQLVDPESEVRKAVLIVETPANVGQSIAFWDSLEPHFDSWLTTLPRHRRDKFHSRIALHFHWGK